MRKAVCANKKTIKSFDLCSSCPKRGTDKQCPYCYVETARKHGFNAKAIYTTRYNGEILRLKQSTIDALNAVGGLRMFSSGDYMPEQRADVKAMLDDCTTVGLKCKAITKQLSFVRAFIDHPALAICHLSVDSCGTGVNHRTAQRLRAKYANIAVRCVCLTPEDLQKFGRKAWIDIITLNHGANGFHQFKRAGNYKEIKEQYADRLCCQSGICKSCEVKCQRKGN